MQILLVGEDDSPPKKAISLFLDLHSDVVKISITPQCVTGLSLDNVSCAIYIDCNPDSAIIDRLQRKRCPLILVADQDCDQSCLFIPFNNFSESISAADPILLIQAKLRSLHLSDPPGYQRNLFPLILTDEDNKKWQQILETEKSQNDSQSIEYELTPEQELVALHYYEGCRDGLRDKEIMKKLGKRRSGYYRSLDCLKDLFGVLDNPALAMKITMLVERGLLKFSAVKTLSR